jgi:hypothetical protein
VLQLVTLPFDSLAEGETPLSRAILSFLEGWVRNGAGGDLHLISSPSLLQGSRLRGDHISRGLSPCGQSIGVFNIEPRCEDDPQGTAQLTYLHDKWKPSYRISYLRASRAWLPLAK